MKLVGAEAFYTSWVQCAHPELTDNIAKAGNCGTKTQTVTLHSFGQLSHSPELLPGYLQQRLQKW